MVKQSHAWIGGNGSFPRGGGGTSSSSPYYDLPELSPSPLQEIKTSCWWTQSEVLVSYWQSLRAVSPPSHSEILAFISTVSAPHQS